MTSLFHKDEPTGDDVRYAGSDTPVAERDISLMHVGRKRREKRAHKRRKRQHLMAWLGAGAVLVAAVAVLGLLIWHGGVDRPAIASEQQPAGILSKAFAAKEAPDLKELAKRSILPPEPEPTPTFASWANLQFHVPIAPKSITEIGFHQAAREYAVHMKTPLKVAKTEKIRKKKTTGKHPVKECGEIDKLGGYCIRMWRNRPGAPDSAVDVGAKPGTPVYAPLSGTVVKVRHYKLYGKVTDWEMHIEPDGDASKDLVVIHIDKPTVEIGQHVEGGLTKIAVVRKISGVIDSQLADFTGEGGNHVHFQLNDAGRSDYKGLRLPDAAGLPPYRGPEKP